MIDRPDATTTHGLASGTNGQPRSPMRSATFAPTIAPSSVTSCKKAYFRRSCGFAMRAADDGRKSKSAKLTVATSGYAHARAPSSSY